MLSRDLFSTPLEPGNGYHIYNRGNEGRLIFFQVKNYSYFLEKFQYYMSSYWDTYAFCLLPNHFHFAVGIKSQEEIFAVGGKDFEKVSKSFIKENWPRGIAHLPEYLNYKMLCEQKFLKEHLPPDIINPFLHHLACWTVSERFRRFLLGYAKAINVQQNRHGSLFQKLFRRKMVPSGLSRSLIAYIHRNPIHHNYSTSIDSYPWSSYVPLMNSSSWLAHQVVMERFEGIAGFQHYHYNKLEDWQLRQLQAIEV